MAGRLLAWACKSWWLHKVKAGGRLGGGSRGGKIHENPHQGLTRLGARLFQSLIRSVPPVLWGLKDCWEAVASPPSIICFPLTPAKLGRIWASKSDRPGLKPPASTSHESWWLHNPGYTTPQGLAFPEPHLRTLWFGS